jgi:hypothetical protein
MPEAAAAAQVNAAAAQVKATAAAAETVNAAAEQVKATAAAAAALNNYSRRIQNVVRTMTPNQYVALLQPGANSKKRNYNVNKAAFGRIGFFTSMPATRKWWAEVNRKRGETAVPAGAQPQGSGVNLNRYNKKGVNQNGRNVYTHFTRNSTTAPFQPADNGDWMLSSNGVTYVKLNQRGGANNTHTPAPGNVNKSNPLIGYKLVSGSGNTAEYRQVVRNSNTSPWKSGGSMNVYKKNTADKFYKA